MAYKDKNMHFKCFFFHPTPANCVGGKCKNYFNESATWDGKTKEINTHRVFIFDRPGLCTFVWHFFKWGGLLAGGRRTSQKDNNKTDITDYSRGLLLKYIEIFFMF